MSSTFDQPARITTVDYVGVTQEFAHRYRRDALRELGIMYSQMEYMGLAQYRRESEIDINVKVICTSNHGIAQAIIIIGHTADTSLREYSCFCTSFGLVAGRIMSVEPYEDDTKYKANIIICQQTGIGRPKKIDMRTVRSSGANMTETIDTVVEKGFFISDELVNIPFTDRYNHVEGSLVLVLVMPLVSYRPTEAECFPYGMEYNEKQGSWSPEVNRRRIAMNTLDNPEAQLTSLYIASTGITGVILADRRLWEGNPNAEPPVDPEPKYNPFRILPIEMNSCISMGI